MKDQSLFARVGGQEQLRVLLRHFYADVRQHRVIGPIFAQHISNWPEHLERIGEFWARITGGPSQFVGDVPAKHFALALAPEHFQAWLSLWNTNCRIYLPSNEATEMFELAEGIARRLRMPQSTGFPTLSKKSMLPG